jgi:hypothetical protein
MKILAAREQIEGLQCRDHIRTKNQTDLWFAAIFPAITDFFDMILDCVEF